MDLQIISQSKNEKALILSKNNESKEYKANIGLIEKINELVVKGEINLNELTSVTPVVTSSFTGTRQAFTIANVLKYYHLGLSLKDLEFPKYHKEPNINI